MSCKTPNYWVDNDTETEICSKSSNRRSWNQLFGNVSLEKVLRQLIDYQKSFPFNFLSINSSIHGCFSVKAKAVLWLLEPPTAALSHFEPHSARRWNLIEEYTRFLLISTEELQRPGGKNVEWNQSETLKKTSHHKVHASVAPELSTASISLPQQMKLPGFHVIGNVQISIFPSISHHLNPGFLRTFHRNWSVIK